MFRSKKSLIEWSQTQPDLILADVLPTLDNREQNKVLRTFQSFRKFDTFPGLDAITDLIANLVNEQIIFADKALPAEKMSLMSQFAQDLVLGLFRYGVAFSKNEQVPSLDEYMVEWEAEFIEPMVVESVELIIPILREGDLIR